MMSFNKKIWYISKYAIPFRYGIASRHFYLAREFNRMGYETIVICSDSNHLVKFRQLKTSYTLEKIDGVDTWWIKTFKYVGARSIRRMISWLDFELKLFFMKKNRLPKPDVVIVSSLSLFTILNGYVLKKKYDCKLIFEVRDIWPLTIIEAANFKSSNPVIKLLAWIEKFGYKKADIVVGTMPNLKEHVKNITGNNSHCFHIPQGVDMNFYAFPEPLPDGYAEQYIPRDKFIIAYAGSIGLTNGLKTIVECAKQLSHNDKIHFLLIGSGDMLESFKLETIDYENITFAPRVRKEQVQTILEQCDLMYDSVLDIKLYDYGLSRNKWIDYFYSGKPLLASYSGFPSMINEAQCGQFVPAEDFESLMKAILYYSALSVEELNKIGMSGKEWVINNRTFDKLASDYSKLF